jgi:hypothetical protein
MTTTNRPDTSEPLADAPVARVAYSLHNAATSFLAPAQRSDETTATLPARRPSEAAQTCYASALADGTVDR